MIQKLENAIKIFVAALREVFDENAYARFLERNRLSASRSSYAAFLRDCEELRQKRPRCC